MKFIKEFIRLQALFLSKYELEPAIVQELLNKQDK